MTRPLTILFSEGSSTSARQSLYALGRLGHVIDICDPQRLCLGRFSRYVRRFYRCPSFTADPIGYLDFLSERLRQQPYDVLFPVHDQVYLLARFPEMFRGRVGVALPPLEAMLQLQSKVGFSRLLAELELPQPRTVVVDDPAGLAQACECPCYVKLAYGTAGRGVWRVENPRDLPPVVRAIEALDENPGEIVVQAAVGGTLGVTQAVFRHGELGAAASYRARATGVGGSAFARQSVAEPLVREHVARLGRRLAWHGAMHIEYLCDPATGSPVYIEANPRIGETMNATLAGVNLCDVLMRVTLDDEVPGEAAGREGVRTHSILTGIMAKAERGEGRLAILAELCRAWTARGVYRDSQDELTRPREDPLSLLPAIVVALQLLAAPGSARRIVRRAVDHYGLTAAAVRRIDALATPR